MATINGNVSLNSSKYSYYITWLEDQVNIEANTSRVRAWVYVKKISDYSSEGNTFTSLSIAGNSNTGNPYIYLYDNNPELLVFHSRTITHNSDGSKSISISANSSELPYAGGYGPLGGTAGATVNLTTIPREATVTNSVSFTIGNNVPLSINNPGNLWVRAELWVNGTLIRTQDLGQVTSGTITPDSGEVDAMYAQVPSATSTSMFVRLKTYSNSGYTTQVGTNKDKSGTASVNQATNKPIFTTATIANVDKSVVVKDKYDNTLTTSSTATLLGSSTKMIKGYSKVRATIATENKAVAQNAASMVKYRLASALQQIEANWSADSTVTLDLDNVVANSFILGAYDSRNLNTDVPLALDSIAEYTPPVITIALARDNNVDPLTALTIGGGFWKKYFGSNSDSDDGSVLNTLTLEYRFKPSGDAWGAQSWTEITPDTTDGVVTFSDYIDGDLGSGGFSVDASFSIEVRAWDKLAATIVEATLNVGTPLMDLTANGVAFKAKYDPTEGGSVQVDGSSLIRLLESGWLPAHEVWTYAAGDSPTFTFTTPGDKTSKYYPGMKLKLTQTGVKYFIVTAVSYSDPNTTITVYGGTDHTLANAAITSPFFSLTKAPTGFPLSPAKWRVSLESTTARTTSTPTNGTWYNAETISIPIGSWSVSYFAHVGITDSNLATYRPDVTLSTANNSESDTRFTTRIRFEAPSAGAYVFRGSVVRSGIVLDLSSKTSYYLNYRATNSNTDEVGIYGVDAETTIYAVSSYL